MWLLNFATAVCYAAALKIIFEVGAYNAAHTTQ